MILSTRKKGSTMQTEDDTNKPQPPDEPVKETGDVVETDTGNGDPPPK